MKGPGFKLKGRERDRVVSDYMELLAGQVPQTQRIPGISGATAAILVLVTAPAVVMSSARWLPIPQAWAMSLGIAIAAAMLVIAILLIAGVIGARRKLWFAAMRRCGHDICVHCGYWLARRAPDSHACPECGTKDEQQPIPLGPRPGATEWPRYDVDAEERRERDDDRGR